MQKQLMADSSEENHEELNYNSFFTADGYRWTRIKTDDFALTGYGIELHIRSILTHLWCDESYLSLLTGVVSGRLRILGNSQSIRIPKEHKLLYASCFHLCLSAATWIKPAG